MPNEEDFLGLNKIFEEAMKISSPINEEEKVVWEEDPVPFKEFLRSKEHMAFPAYSDRQMMIPDYLFGEDPKKMFTNGKHTAVVEAGKGGGKDTVSVHCIDYAIYVLLCAKNIRLLFPGIGPTDPIDCVNVAYNDKQSKIVFFEKFKTSIINWKWLKRKYNFKVSGKLLNPNDSLEEEEKVIINQNSIFFPKKIRAFSLNSQQEGWEGLNPLLFVLDEFCFDSRQRIVLENGKNERIGKIVNKKMPVKVLSKNENGTLEYKKVVNWFKYAVKDKEVIKLGIGFPGQKNFKRKIICTKNHWIYTEKGKNQAGNLKVGDKVFVYGDYFSDFQKSFIYGSLLGDAHLNLRNKKHGAISNSLFFNHGEPQKEYLFLKHKILKNVAQSIRRSHSGYRKEYSNYCFGCSKNEGMSEIIENCTINGKKNINPNWIEKLDKIALMFWYLDDGNLHLSRKKNKKEYYNCQFSTQSFSFKEVKLLVDKMNSLNYDCKIRKWKKRKCDGKQAFKIYLDVNGTKNFLKDISPFIPKCMSYKTNLPCKGDNNFSIGEIPNLGLMPIIEIKKDLRKKRKFVYDIEVEDNHNYFAGNILVSNSAFTDQNKTRNSDKVLGVAETSAQSRFGNNYKGFVVSYPRFKDDSIQRLRKQYEGSLSVYTDKATTFEMKPERCFSGKWFNYKGYKVPLEYKERFEKKPEDSETKYLCLPQHADDPFFKEPAKIDACIDSRMPIVFDEDYTFNEGGKRYVAKRIKKVNLGVNPNMYCVIVDLGISGDPSAVSIWHKERLYLPGSFEDHYYQDYIGLWKPDEETKTIVKVDNVKDFVIDLCKVHKLPVFMITCDRWNSASMMQAFTANGFNNEHYHLGTQDYDDARTKIYSGVVHLLNDKLGEDSQTEELKKLVNDGKGGADHIDGEHNDRAQTTFAALKLLSSNDNPNKKNHGMKMNDTDGEIIKENINSDGIVISDSGANLGDGFSFRH